MIDVNEKRFRTGAAIAAVLFVATWVNWYFPLFAVSQETADLLAWVGFESAWPPRVAHWVLFAQNVLTLSGLIGSFFFWKPARWLVAFGLIGAVLAVPYLGVSVSEPRMAAIGLAGFVAECWVLFASFWTPVAERFAFKETDILVRMFKGR